MSRDLFSEILNLNLLCCPVLIPQMTGEPSLPGEVMLKVSVKQSPNPAPNFDDYDKNVNLKNWFARQL
jgi:hypothetical protein